MRQPSPQISLQKRRCDVSQIDTGRDTRRAEATPRAEATGEWGSSQALSCRSHMDIWTWTWKCTQDRQHGARPARGALHKFSKKNAACSPTV